MREIAYEESFNPTKFKFHKVIYTIFGVFFYLNILMNKMRKLFFGVVYMQ